MPWYQKLFAENFGLEHVNQDIDDKRQQVGGKRIMTYFMVVQWWAHEAGQDDDGPRKMAQGGGHVLRYHAWNGTCRTMATLFQSQDIAAGRLMK